MHLLLELTLRTTLLLGIAGTLTMMLRSSSAGTRSLVWSVAILAVLASPIVATFGPTVEVPLRRVSPGNTDRDPDIASTRSSARVSEADSSEFAARLTDGSGPIDSGASRTDAASSLTAATTAQKEEPISWRVRPQWLIAAWAIGVALLIMQLAAGIAQVARIARRAQPVSDGPISDRLFEAAAHVGLRRPVRLLESDGIDIPVTWHYLRPTVLVPRDMQDWSAECQTAVLVHELEHLRRRDCWMQALARVVVALQWFNPIAWFASHRFSAEREHACDDSVLRAGFRPSTYARHLLDVACSARHLPRGTVVAALASSTRLRGRVQTILDPTIGRQSPDRRTTVSVASIALALVLPIAAIQPVTEIEPMAGDDSRPAVAVTPTSTTMPGEAAPTAIPASSPAPAPVAQEAWPSIDELVKMRIHGVSPELIGAMNDLFGPGLEIDEIVKLRIHGVTGEFAREMRAAFGGLDMDALVAAEIHGISPEYAGQMSQVLGETLTFEDLKRMRIHGIKGEFVGAMSGVFNNPAIDDLVRVKIHGVTGEYARGMRDVFGAALDLDDLVAARIHGVSTEFASGMSDLLDEELSFETLKRMRIHGVSTEWVEELHEAGHTDLTAEEFVRIKISGLERVLRRREGGQQ